ncbi:MAG: zf-HC2 domain-containing protein [Verrucomicrobia bacterium]|nr:zf-HC2 domain-containing protein [Verrucomicrobiota bacterium]
MATQQHDKANLDATSGRCEDIQELLFDFVSHELEASRADLVRRHLSRCPACKREAAELLETVTALRAATEATAPTHVSADRRERMAWTVMHPVRDWLREHHLLISLVLAAILVAIAWVIVDRVAPMKQDPLPEGIEVEIVLDPPARP